MEQEPEGIFTRSQDQRPSGLTGARAQLLLSCKPPPSQGRHKNQVQEHEVSGVHFLQDAAPVPGATARRARRSSIATATPMVTAKSARTPRHPSPGGTSDATGVPEPQVKCAATSEPCQSKLTFVGLSDQDGTISFSSEVTSVAASHLRRGRC